MSREIKFRAWDLDCEVMSMPDIIYIRPHTLIEDAFCASIKEYEFTVTHEYISQSKANAEKLALLDDVLKIIHRNSSPGMAYDEVRKLKQELTK